MDSDFVSRSIRRWSLALFWRTLYDVMVHYAPFSECDDALDASLFGDESARSEVEPVTEFTAMETLGAALAALTADEARVRVLRWAAERFAPELLQAQARARIVDHVDPTLSTEDLDEFFDEGTRDEESAAPAPTHVETSAAA